MKVYSKQSLSVLDSAGSNTIVHYDGQTPTGYTSSAYRGMNGWTAADNTVVVADEICGLADIFDAARVEGFFWWQLFRTCLMDAPNICLNPLNWINACDETAV